MPRLEPVPSTATTDVQAALISLRGEDGLARDKARRTLTALGSAVVPDLVLLLSDVKADVRWEAAKALAEIADADAAPALVSALDDGSFGVRWLAAAGLIALGRKAVLPVLQALTARSHSIWLRDGAHHVLYDVARADPGLRPILTEVVSSLEGEDAVTASIRPVFKAIESLRAS